MEKEAAIGGLLLLASVLTTCVYESGLVRSLQSFEEGRAAVVSLARPEISGANDGAFVHFSGLITTTAEAQPSSGDGLQLRVSPFVMDPTFGVAVKGVRLHRQVEMLQWVETSHTSMSSRPEDDDQRVDDDRERVYMYDLVWRREAIDSNGFNDPSHWNPPADSWAYTSLVVTAPGLVVGDFALADELVDQIERKDRVPLDATNRRMMANVLEQRRGRGWEAAASGLQNASIEDDFVYLRNERREPVLGDLRVFFEVVPNYPVTVCAGQAKGGRLEPFVTPSGHSLFLLEDGIMDAGELFDKKSTAEVRKNRFYRLFASVLGFIAFLVLRRPLSARFGQLLGGVQQHLLAASLALATTFSVVGANWVLYRPLWALIMWLGGWVPSLGLLLVQRTKDRLKDE